MEIRDAILRTKWIRSRDQIPDEPILFERCVFEACSAAVYSHARERIRVNDVTLRNCEVRGGGIRGLAITESVVDGLVVKSLPQVLGCTFHHVVIRGKINQLMIHHDLPTVYDQIPFAAAAGRLHAEIDWALDISELDSPDFEIRGIPSRLIIGDPDTQAVVPRYQAINDAWKDVDLSGTSFRIALEMLADSTWDDYILIAPRTGRSSLRAREVIAELISRGIAQPPRTPH